MPVADVAIIVIGRRILRGALLMRLNAELIQSRAGPAAGAQKNPLVRAVVAFLGVLERRGGEGFSQPCPVGVESLRMRGQF
jgi:hypothetical protein